MADACAALAETNNRLKIPEIIKRLNIIKSPFEVKLIGGQSILILGWKQFFQWLMYVLIGMNRSNIHRVFVVLQKFILNDAPRQ
jgi:hypothetical protein